MKVVKILNQNAVLVLDGDQEKVAIGKGIGFEKKRNDLIFDREIERIYVIEPANQKKIVTLASQIDEKYFFVAERIINHAETVLMEKMNEHLVIALADHISFAAENIQNGIVIKNKLLKEIEAIYNEEFGIAQWAVDFLCRELDLPYSYNEAGFIAIHIHSARKGQTDNSKSIREVSIISDIILFIEKELGTDLHSEKMSLNYTRLTTHLRLLLQRFQHQQYAVLDSEIIEIVKTKYSKSYEISKKIRGFLMQKYQLSITHEELAYIAIHIERLRLAC